jgi:hydroxymethylglutaryl-CoA lyase
LGGCPFAQDELVGNLPTEAVIAALKDRGAQLPALKPLDAILRATVEIGGRYKISASEP